MKFWQFYRVILRRRWMIVGLIAVTLIAILWNTKNDQPYYAASIKIMPSETASSRPILPSPNSSAASPMEERHTENQLPNLMALLKSRRVAERTVRVANLSISPDMLLNQVEVSTVSNPGARTKQDSGTDIIRVRVVDADPGRAVRTANALGHVFATFYEELSHREAAGNLEFLETELRHSQRNLDDAAERLREFKRQNGIDSSASASANSSASAQVSQITMERDAARASLAEIQAQLNQVDSQLRRTGPTRKVVEGSSNTAMVRELETQLANLTVQLNDARSKYEDNHPKVIALNSSINEVSRKLQTERGKVGSTVAVIRNPIYESLLQDRSKLAYQRDGLAARLSQLNVSVARAAGNLKPGIDVTLLQLENDFQTTQANYTSLKNQVSQARVNVKETTSTGAIHVVDEAMNAEGPIGSNRSLFLILGGILSLILGVGLAITMESLDNRIRTNLDVEELLGLPVTALIPRAIGTSNSKLARITYTEPVSPISEAYRFLRTDILLSAQETGAKAIMVATAKPGQGGTNTVANLGISLALDGKRVILVDADMRRPSLHRIFKVENEFGLSDVLSNQKDIGDVIRGTEVDNLLLVPAGNPPSNPSELLGSGRMRNLVQWLAEHADYVVFDTPSAIAFTDAVVLSRVVDGVVLVVRAQQVPRGAELQVRNLLNKANANIIGVVLNDVEPESVDSYYYHSHYYPDVATSKQKLLQSLPGVRSLPPTED